MSKSRLKAYCRVVQGSGCLLQVMRACQFDETIAQILPLQKYEDYEYCSDAGFCERPQQGRNQGGDALQGRRLSDLDRYRSRLLSGRRKPRLNGRTCGGVLWLVELFAKILKYVGGTFERPAGCRRAAKRLDLFSHDEFVTREITRQLTL
jgi:hypothetical protein